MVNSMTGFAAATGGQGPYRWAWELRSVNAKGLDLRLRVPDWIGGLEQGARAELARRIKRGNISLNLRLTRAGSGSSDRAALLDQRDQLLERLAGFTTVGTQFAADGTVAVSLGTNPPRSFVQGGTAGTLASATAADGTLSFSVDGQAMAPGSGSLAGAALALTELASVRTRLDTIAAGIADTVNNAQAAGSALDGSQG